MNWINIWKHTQIRERQTDREGGLWAGKNQAKRMLPISIYIHHLWCTPPSCFHYLQATVSLSRLFHIKWWSLRVSLYLFESVLNNIYGCTEEYIRIGVIEYKTQGM